MSARHDTEHRKITQRKQQNERHKRTNASSQANRMDPKKQRQQTQMYVCAMRCCCVMLWSHRFAVCSVVWCGVVWSVICDLFQVCVCCVLLCCVLLLCLFVVSRLASYDQSDLFLWSSCRSNWSSSSVVQCHAQSASPTKNAIRSQHTVALP